MSCRVDLMSSSSPVPPAVLLDEIEAAESEGNDDRIEGLLCGAVKQLKMNRAKPDITLYLSLMFLAKIKPNVFATEGVIEVSECSTFVLISSGFVVLMSPLGAGLMIVVLVTARRYVAF